MQEVEPAAQRAVGRRLPGVPVKRDRGMRPELAGRPIALDYGASVDRTRPGRLYRIDPATNRVLGRPLTLPRIVPAPYVGVAVGEGTVVVKDIDDRTLTRIELVP